MWRTAVPRGERVAGAVILLLLLGTGVAIAVKGQVYDPDLFALNDDLLGEAPSPFARVLPVSWESPTWQPAQTVERYGPNNLYEKINGRADEYLAYSVQGLEVQSFTAQPDDGRFVDVYLYDMGTPLDAFGIFSTERTPGADPVTLGKEGYDAQGSIFFHQSQFYAQVIPAEADPESLEAALTIAQLVAAMLPADAEDAAGDPAALLPPDGLDPESVQYVKEDVLGLDFLRNGIMATYEIAGESLSVFLIREESPDTAAAALDQYAAYIARYGTVVQDASTARGRWIVGDVSGFFDVVFTQGEWIGGVSGAMAREPAERLAEQTRAALPAGNEA